MHWAIKNQIPQENLIGIIKEILMSSIVYYTLIKIKILSYTCVSTKLYW